VATDQNGQETVHIQILTIQDTKAPVPTSNFESSITVNCENITEIPAIEFIDNCSNNVNVTFEETNNFDVNNPSNYNIIRTWTVSDDCDNQKVYTQTVNVILNNIVTTLNDRACYDDGVLNLNNYLENNQSGGNWIVLEGNVSLDQNIFNPENVVLGTYKFSYSIPNGSCLNTVEVSIEIHDECIPLPCGKEDVIISKVVTPNGDPYNEYFTITGIETCGFVIELQIFNRWGAKIYDNSNYQNNWNGFAHNSSVGKAEKVPNGTYFYIINLKNSGLEPIAKAFYVGTK
jgi:gliding motility-associated-like protein